MTSLEQFKAENGLKTIQFLRSKNKPNGIQFCDLPGIGKIFLSPKTDTNKPLFVIVNDGSINPALKGTLWVVNETNDTSTNHKNSFDNKHKMVKAYFGEIRRVLIENLKQSKYDVYIAVAWITDKIYEDIILNLLQKGVTVTIITNNDEINLKGNVDWNKLVRSGVNLYWDNHHHKFCVIDRKKVITGSFNWTYMATNRENRENIIIIENEVDLIDRFSEEFILLKTVANKQILEPEKITEHIIIEKQIEKIVHQNITSVKKYKAYHRDGNYACGRCGESLRLLGNDISKLEMFHHKNIEVTSNVPPPKIRIDANYYCENCGSYYDKSGNYL